MGTGLIISYDGTANDDDALALGKMLAPAGFTPVLAYVRHAKEFDPGREELAEHDAEQRLERGAGMLGDPGAKREVLFGASTGEGLGQLAERAGAPLVVFGSDYRTAPGHSQPGTSAQHLLDGGAVSVAVAVAGLRTRLNEPIKLDRSARRWAQERGRTEDGGRTCGEARCEARGVARRAGGSDRGWLTARRVGRSCHGRRRCARRAGQGPQLGPGSTRWRTTAAVADGTAVG